MPIGPPPGWHGKCKPGEAFPASKCNQKLIGAQHFNAAWGGDAGIEAQRPWEFNSPRDYNGHGTHTASTAGGNNGVPADRRRPPCSATISGMAPRARIADVQGALVDPGRVDRERLHVDLVAAIDQAVADGVDVINYSISGTLDQLPRSGRDRVPVRGRCGRLRRRLGRQQRPDRRSTVAHPSPWITTVAAGTHNRERRGLGHARQRRDLQRRVRCDGGRPGAVDRLDGRRPGRRRSDQVALCYSAADNAGGRPRPGQGGRQDRRLRARRQRPRRQEPGGAAGRRRRDDPGQHDARTRSTPTSTSCRPCTCQRNADGRDQGLRGDGRRDGDDQPGDDRLQRRRRR